MVIGIIVFAAAVCVLTAVIVKSYGRIDSSVLAVYIALIAWGAMFFGLFIARYARPAAMLYAMVARLS